ncbi:hypothetical protein VPH35_085085 [Triticum aestivum]
MSSEMESTGSNRPCCTLGSAGADVHCHADTTFSCVTSHAQAHRTSSLASNHRLTRVQPEPNHVCAEVSARAMELDPWVARLSAAEAGSTRVPPPNNVRTKVTARAMGLDPWATRLRAAAAGSTRVPLPNDVCTEVTARAMELDPWVARLCAAEAGSTRVPPPNNVRTKVTARAMGLDPWATRLRAAAAGSTRVPLPNDVCTEVTARAMELDPWVARLCAAEAGSTRVPPPNNVRTEALGVARLRAAAAFRTLRVEFAAAPRMPLRVAMAVALWREVAAHGVVHQPDHALQRLVTLTAAVDVEEDSVDCAIGGAHEVRMVAVDVEEDSVDCAIGGAREVRTVAVDVEEDCAIVSPGRIPHQLCLFV